jgi:hypothetical protein
LTEQQPLLDNISHKKGKWNRSKNFKNKINIKQFLNWIKEQPKQYSHYTRKIDRKSKLYFTKITNLKELFEKYVKDMEQQNQIPMKKTSFRNCFKLYCKKKIGFTKNHLDTCSVCLRIRTMLDRFGANLEIKGKLEIFLHKHLFEADKRYQIWQKDKNLIGISEDFNETFEEDIFQSDETSK